MGSGKRHVRAILDERDDRHRGLPPVEERLEL